MAGYFPSVNYDPNNPTSWNAQPNRMAPPLNQRQGMYGPMRQTYQRPSFTPNIQQQRFPNYGQNSSSKTNVYISGFPTDWNSANLRDLFKPFGTINEVKIITKKSNEPNRGVAFVHFSKETSASNSIEALREKIPSGCSSAVTVRFANSNKNTQPEYIRTMRVSVTRFKPEAWSLESALNLYISQLPKGITEDKVREMFSSFGAIKKMRLSGNNEKGSVAFVHYDSPEDAVTAVAKMDQFVMNDLPATLRVRFANVNKSNIPEWFNVEHIKNMQTTTNIYVSQIPDSWSEKELKSAFQKHGNIYDVKLLARKEATGKVAFVHYDQNISACKAVALVNDTLPEKDATQNIMVTFARMDASTFDRIMGATYSQPPAGMMGGPMSGAYGPNGYNQGQRPPAGGYQSYGSNMCGPN